MAAGIIDEFKTLEYTLRDINSSLVDSWSSDDEFNKFCSSVLTLATSTPHTGSTVMIPSLPDDTPLHDLVQRLIEVLIQQGSNNLLASSSCHHQSQYVSSSRGGYTTSSSAIITTSPHWRTLHTRLGTQRMADLLMHYSIFMPLHSNGYYIQLTGCPFSTMLSKRSADEDCNKRHTVALSAVAHNSVSSHQKPVTRLSVLLQRVFDHKSMLYDRSHGKFKCILNKYNPSNTSAEKLARRVFNTKAKLPKYLLKAKDLLHTSLAKHRNCRYNTLLNRYCKDDHHSEGLNSSNHQQVILFVRAAIKYVFPQKWFGSKHNESKLLKGVTEFITLGATESLTVQQMINGVKISDCPWVQPVRSNVTHRPPSQSLKQLELFCKWVVFLVEEFIKPLIKHYFYVTEKGRQSRNHLFYYRKNIWAKIEEEFTDGAQNKLFAPVDNMDRLPQLVKGGLSVSSLRLQPKSHGVRPIISSGSRTTRLPNGETVEFFPISIKLKQISSVLQYELSSSPHMMDCSVNSFSEIYNKWKSFALSERAKPMEERDYPCHFFVTVDIKSCYDTIDCNKMFNILSELFTKSSYQFRRMSGVPLHNTSHTPTTHMIPMGTDESLIDAAQRYCATHRVSNVVLVDQGKSIELYRTTLLKNFHSHLRNHVIKHGGQYLLQHTGIPQGSVVSPLLCGIYLSKMEEECFPTEFQYAGLLMRMVDDYLFVTDMPDAARDFLEMMSNGIPEYNCTINTDKTVTNFIIDQQDGTVSPNHDMEWFPWCGLLFNVKSLDVRVDYSRYLTCPIRDTVSIVTHSTPFSKLLVKTIRSAKIRCSPILLDTQLLSVREVMRNVYENYLLTAMKFHINVEKLHIGQRAKSSAKYFMMVIIKCGASFYHSAKTCFTKLRPSSDRSVSDGSHFTLSRDLCSCLCVQGFVTVLHKKQSRYILLLRLLRARLRNKMRHLDNREKQLMNNIVQDTAKDHVMRIKY